MRTWIPGQARDDTGAGKIPACAGEKRAGAASQDLLSCFGVKRTKEPKGEQFQ